MGAARINSSLLDLKFHPAATTLKITNDDGKNFMLNEMVASCDCLILSCFYFHFYEAFL